MIVALRFVATIVPAAIENTIDHPIEELTISFSFQKKYNLTHKNQINAKQNNNLKIKMPCSQRRYQNHCGRGGGGGMRFHHHHHPYMAFHPFFHCSNSEGGQAQEEILAHLLNMIPTTSNNNNDSGNDNDTSAATKTKSRWNESDDAYTFEMDIPGVKARHVTIEEKNGEMEITAIRMSRNGEEVLQTYQEVLYVRPSTSNLAQATATLHDGVLTLTVPKTKRPEPFKVVVESDTPPAPAAVEAMEEEDTKTEFRVALDLPGVKVKDLQVQVRHNQEHHPTVFLEATRTLGGRTMMTRRLIHVRPTTTDMTQARAFLQDGVFTLLAPIPTVATNDDQDANAEAKPAAMRTILVTDGEMEEEEEEVPSVAALNLNEDKTTNVDGEEEMKVETVVEADHGWEEVNDSAKKSSDEETG